MTEQKLLPMNGLGARKESLAFVSKDSVCYPCKRVVSPDAWLQHHCKLFFCCECSLFIKLWHFCQLWPCFFRMGQIENENTFVLFYTFTLYSTVFSIHFLLLFRSCHTNQYFQKRLPPGLHPLSVWPAKPHNIT